MIVRVDGSLGSELSTEELDSSVGDDLYQRSKKGRRDQRRKADELELKTKDGLIRTTDLVNVHVGLSSRSGLEDDERELVDELTADDL